MIIVCNVKKQQCNQHVYCHAVRTVSLFIQPDTFQYVSLLQNVSGLKTMQMVLPHHITSIHDTTYQPHLRLVGEWNPKLCFFVVFFLFSIMADLCWKKILSISVRLSESESMHWESVQFLTFELYVHCASNHCTKSNEGMWWVHTSSRVDSMIYWKVDQK